MKRKIISLFIILILIFVKTNLFSQEIKQLTYFLNSEKFEISKVFINPESIESLNMDRTAGGGKIYISTKNNKFKHYDLSDILRKYTDIKKLNDSILFKINGRIMSDISNVKIDKSYYIYVDVERLTNVKYIEEQFNKLVIVSINLELKKRKPKVVIRGNQHIIDRINDKID